MAQMFFLAAKNSNAADSNGNITSAQYGTGKRRHADYIKAGALSGVNVKSGNRSCII
jgi:hypothetical protein